MTTITYHRDRKGFDITMQGHAGYAARGADIVCASLSALAQALYIRVAETTSETDYDIDIDEDQCLIHVSAKGAIARGAFDTVLCGLEQVAEAFPEYVAICEQ